MEDSQNYAEYTVEKKAEGSYRLKRVLLKIALWLPLPIICIVFILLNIPIWVILIPVYPLIWMKILKPCFYPYVYIEYEYQIVSGEMRFAEILGRCKRRETVNIRISEMSLIAPYRDDWKAKADAPDIGKRYYAVSSMSAPEIYVGIFEDDNGVKSAVFFEPTNKALGLLRFHNRLTVVEKVRV